MKYTTATLGEATHDALMRPTVLFGSCRTWLLFGSCRTHSRLRVFSCSDGIYSCLFNLVMMDE